MEALDEVFDRHGPTDAFIDLSERRPCVASHPSARIDPMSDAPTDVACDLAVVTTTLDEDAAVERSRAAWRRLGPDGILAIVTPPRFPLDAGCPLRPRGASIERAGGAWFVRKTETARPRATGSSLRGCHGDDPSRACASGVEDA